MDTVANPQTSNELEAEHAETDAACLAHERMLLDEAREDMRAGRFIADPDVDAWLAHFEAGEPLAMPDAPAPSCNQ